VILTEKRVTYQKEIVRFNDVIKNLLKKRHPFMTDELRTYKMGEAAVKAAEYQIRNVGTVEFW
jgi:acetyl/propionyl-CoA carboxylase alpha subunit